MVLSLFCWRFVDDKYIFGNGCFLLIIKLLFVVGLICLVNGELKFFYFFFGIDGKFNKFFSIRDVFER